MKLEDIKIGMTVLYDRFSETGREPIEATVDSIAYRADKAHVWISPISKEPRFLVPLSRLSLKEPRIAAVLKVKHLEATKDGYEEGDVFTLSYLNTAVLPTHSDLYDFLLSMTLILGYDTSGGRDYAVYKVEPDGIPVSIGPGDQVVIYEDRKFGVYVGVGTLNVINDTVCVGR